MNCQGCKFSRRLGSTAGKALNIPMLTLKHRLLVGFLVILWALSDWGIPKSVLGNISYQDRPDSTEKPKKADRWALKIPPKLPSPNKKPSAISNQPQTLNQIDKTDKSNQEARKQESEKDTQLPFHNQGQTTGSPKPETKPVEPVGVRAGHNEVNFTPKLAIALSLGLLVGVIGISAFLFGVVRKLKRENADLRNQFLRQGQALVGTESSFQVEGVKQGSLNVNGTVRDRKSVV